MQLANRQYPICNQILQQLCLIFALSYHLESLLTRDSFVETAGFMFFFFVPSASIGWKLGRNLLFPKSQTSFDDGRDWLNDLTEWGGEVNNGSNDEGRPKKRRSSAHEILWKCLLSLEYSSVSPIRIGRIHFTCDLPSRQCFVYLYVFDDTCSSLTIYYNLKSIICR